MEPRAAIVVNEHMVTSDPDIYAVGDAVELTHFVSGSKALIALAGPPTGRAASPPTISVAGKSRYAGAQGSSIIKLFHMTAAFTGLNEKAAQAAGIPYDKAVTYSASHATYYPGAENMTIKTLFDPSSGRVLGAQIVASAVWIRGSMC